ncbi:MAG TPA: hypothetical protein VK633_14770, partial [Verrucomicrobiae bacterium]|nr:hypothetical protein [Verrucomicrobiae bacterium]
MPEPQKSRAHGCVFYGLITVALVFLGVVAGIYFGTKKAVRFAIENYTTNAPITIPSLELSTADQKAIAARLAQQFEAGANGRGPEELVLGEEELNVLIAQSPDLKNYRKQIYLQPQADQLKAFLSLQLDQFKPWEEFSRKLGGTNYAGRFLNGTAYVNITVTNGVLKIAPRKLVVSATTLPDQFIKQFPWD